LFDLAGDYGESARRSDGCNEAQVVRQHRAIEEEPIEGNEGTDAGKKRQQHEENHPGRHRQQAVLVELLIGSPGNISPTSPWDTPRKSGAPAATFFQCPLLVDKEGLIPARGLTEGVFPGGPSASFKLQDGRDSEDGAGR
jgi:hypothetical protein